MKTKAELQAAVDEIREVCRKHGVVLIAQSSPESVYGEITVAVIDDMQANHVPVSALQIPCETGKVSDGYHTFDELYEHRCSLFLALMKAAPGLSWISMLHDDGSAFDGWFVAGMCLPTGDVTYHLPAGMWSLACATGAQVRDRAPKWDGHTSADVVKRVQAWIKATQNQSPCEFACQWYKESEVEHFFSRQRKNLLTDNETPVPQDIYSQEFATWLVNQYRLAMNKGIQIGRGA